ncbi:hypothetical protein LMG28614_07145 [Paraburkholderia ultramafica]|uniref:Uncharacterized protein n=1 Tax=Paraburkholderia ultramafica TaxID=1544867 RepID=A0A6S7BQT1_9BURK|nr:hypothetical protein LMG28614_07145 [Paraburkholderia ultramafica]
MPVDADTDSCETLLLVVDRPVDSELAPVDSEPTLTSVAVERLAIVLLVDARPVDNELTPVEMTPTVAVVEAVTVDRLAILLLAVVRPVDSEARPVDAEVDKFATLLLVAFRSVDRLAMLLFAVTTLLDSVFTFICVEVDSDVNWLTFTASVAFTPAATFASVTTGAPVPPSVTFVCVLSSYWTESAMLVEIEPSAELVVVDRVVRL